MRHALMAGIAAIALALAIGALVATREAGPPDSASLPQTKSLEEGRAATTGTPDAEPRGGY